VTAVTANAPALEVEFSAGETLAHNPIGHCT
jgi:hypothetical protein